MCLVGFGSPLFCELSVEMLELEFKNADSLGVFKTIDLLWLGRSSKVTTGSKACQRISSLRRSGPDSHLALSLLQVIDLHVVR